METIFSKKLSQTDVHNRLAIPTDKLKLFAALSLGEQERILVHDDTGHKWRFRLSTRKRGNFLKPVISCTEWLQFVRAKDLKKGDKITFYRKTNEADKVRFKVRTELKAPLIFDSRSNKRKSRG